MLPAQGVASEYEILERKRQHQEQSRHGGRLRDGSSWWSYPLLRRIVGFRGVALWALLCRRGRTRRAVGIVLRWTGAAHARRRLVVLHGAACRSLTNVLRTHRVAVAIGTPLCGSNRRAANNHGCSNADCSEIDLHNWLPAFMLLKILQRAKRPTVPLHEGAVRLGPGSGAATQALNDTVVGTRGGVRS